MTGLCLLLQPTKCPREARAERRCLLDARGSALSFTIYRWICMDTNCNCQRVCVQGQLLADACRTQRASWLAVGLQHVLAYEHSAAKL